MADIDSMLEAIDFVEAHLTEEISIADVAEAVSFSLFHFSRTFSRVTHHTPYGYLMRRRLCEAARCLLESDEKIIDIAFRYQFNAPETFSRTFKRVFNLQPRQVKSQEWLDHRLLMTRLTPEYLEFLSGGACSKPVGKRLPTMQVAGIAAQIDTLDPSGDVVALWDLLGKEIRAGNLELDNRDFYGVMIFYPSHPTNQGMYLAGVSLTEDERVPKTFVEKKIPAMDYACFDLPKMADAAHFARNYIYQTWWPKASGSSLAAFEIECFSDCLDCLPASMDVPLPESLCFPLAIR